MTVSCSQVNALRQAYIDNRLSPEMQAAIKRHALTCDLCRGRLALSYRVKQEMGGAVKSALGEPVPSREQVLAIKGRLEQTIGRSPGVRWGRSSFAMAMFTLLLTATAVVGAVGAGF